MGYKWFYVYTTVNVTWLTRYTVMTLEIYIYLSYLGYVIMSLLIGLVRLPISDSVSTGSLILVHGPNATRMLTKLA